MPGDSKSSKRLRVGVGSGDRVRVKGPAWVWLNKKKDLINIQYDNPVDSLGEPRLESIIDPSPQTDQGPGG